MKVTRAIGRIIKPFVNFPRWMNLNQLSNTAKTIVGTIKDLKTERQAPIRKETFEEARKRLNLSEEDLQERMKFCFRLSIIYLLVGLLFFAYTIYLIMHLSIGFILALLITALMFAFSFQQHFWYFQIKTRQLGATVKEWRNFLFRGAKK